MSENRFRLTKLFYPSHSKLKIKEVFRLSGNLTSLYLPGTMKLVMGLLALSSACCQNLLVRSILLKESDCTRPISSIQSLISRMVKRSGLDFRLTALQSKTTRMPLPWGLGTRQMGELQVLCYTSMAPFLSSLSTRSQIVRQGSMGIQMTVSETNHKMEPVKKVTGPAVNVIEKTK